jgi:integrase
MGRVVGRLTARKVATARPPKGRKAIFLSDGGNLQLQVTLGPDENVRRSWVFAYELAGTRHWLGLGPTHTVSLREARLKARTLRGQLVDNIDPFVERRKTRQALLAEKAKTITFEECCKSYIALHGDGWSLLHLQQWKQSLKNHVYPKIGALAPADIDSAVVMRLIEPHWKVRTVTASRVLDRIGMVLDWATTSGYRVGDNPCRLVRAALPSQAKITTVKHYPAMPFDDVPAFLVELRTVDSLTARALELLILSTSRTGEVLLATWSEFNFAERLWTRPADHMKSRRVHTVPLSDRMVEILRALPPPIEGLSDNRVFPMHRAIFGFLLKRMGRAGATPHGFRSSFKQWTRKRTRFPRDTVERQLDHKIAKATEESYARDAEMFEERIALVNAWSTFCCTPPPEEKADNVVAIGEPLRGRQ